MYLIANKNFTVVRQIANHLDSTNYYVEAVIRNAFTDEIITKLDLENKGDQRYKKDWKVPVVSSGQSYYISIVTSVYTDAEHTSKSPDYGDEEMTLQVAPTDLATNTNGGGTTYVGETISTEDIKDLIRSEFEKQKPIEIPPQIETDLSGVLKAIKEVDNKIKPVIIPKVDLRPIKSALDALKSSIEAIKIPELDISPIIKKIDEIDENDNIDKEELKHLFKEAVTIIVKKNEEKLKRELKSIKLIPKSVKIESFLINDEGEKKRLEEEAKAKENAPKPFNINNLYK